MHAKGQGQLREGEKQQSFLHFKSSLPGSMECNAV